MTKELTPSRLTLADDTTAIATERGVTRDEIDLAKRTVAPDLRDDEFALFLHECKRRGVHPLDRLIFPRLTNRNDPNKRRVAFVTSVDYLRARAAATGQYVGNDDPVFDAPAADVVPTMATATVWKLVGGVRCPYTATARWREYYPGDADGFMWRKMPHMMLGKCAEALALRKAYPQELSGLYANEELEQASEPPAVETVQAAAPRRITRSSAPAPVPATPPPAPEATTPEPPATPAPPPAPVSPVDITEDLELTVREVTSVTKNDKTYYVITFSNGAQAYTWSATLADQARAAHNLEALVHPTTQETSFRAVPHKLTALQVK